MKNEFSSFESAPNGGFQTTHADYELSLKNAKHEKAISKDITDVNAIHASNSDIDTQYQHLIEKKWGLIDRMVNPTMHAQLVAVKADLFKVTASYRKNFFTTVLNARLAALEEKCSSGIICIRAHHREMVASFVLGKMQSLREEIKNRQVQMIELLKGKYNYAETIKLYPSLYNKFMETIFREETTSLLFMDRLIENFENSIEEQIKNYSS